MRDPRGPTDPRDDGLPDRGVLLEEFARWIDGRLERYEWLYFATLTFNGRCPRHGHGRRGRPCGCDRVDFEPPGVQYAAGQLSEFLVRLRALLVGAPDATVVAALERGMETMRCHWHLIVGTTGRLEYGDVGELWQAGRNDVKLVQDRHGVAVYTVKYTLKDMRGNWRDVSRFEYVELAQLTEGQWREDLMVRKRNESRRRRERPGLSRVQRRRIGSKLVQRLPGSTRADRRAIEAALESGDELGARLLIERVSRRLE